MMSEAAARSRSSDVMETTSMTSTFIAGLAGACQKGKIEFQKRVRLR
jgi:hypothetical protein